MPKTGKSTLVGKISDESTCKRGKHSIVKSKFTLEDSKVTVYDIPGIYEMRDCWDYYYNRVDAVVFFIKTTSTPEEKIEARDELQSLLFRNVWLKKPLLVLGTGNHIKGGMTCKEMVLALNLVSLSEREIACFSVSIEKNDNIDLVKKWIVEIAHLIKKRESGK